MVLKSFLPELFFILGLIVMPIVDRYRACKTPKTFFTISKLFLIISLIALIFIEKNSFNVFFKSLLYVFAFFWFYLSYRWFLVKDKSSLVFYMLCLFIVMNLSFCISSRDFLTFAVCLNLVFFSNFYLIRLNDLDDKIPNILNRYKFFLIILFLISSAGLALVYEIIGSFDYESIHTFLLQNEKLSPLNILLFTLLLSLPLFSLAIVPFHFWLQSAVKRSILPVSGFISIVPNIAYFACLIRLVSNVFAPMPHLKELLIFFACLSIIIGVIGANSQNNLRKLFACSSIYHFGVILLIISSLDKTGLMSAFTYLMTYLLAIFGIYTVFFGFRYKGEYLSDLKDISGIFNSKPYISGSFLVFVVSLMGMPPMLGFLGRFAAVNHLFAANANLLILLVFVALVVISFAYLRVVKTIYFEDSSKKFDRADKGIYICLFINMLLVIISILNPQYLLNDFADILHLRYL